MILPYSKIRNLDSHWGKAISYWIGVVIKLNSIILFTDNALLARPHGQEQIFRGRCKCITSSDHSQNLHICSDMLQSMRSPRPAESFDIATCGMRHSLPITGHRRPHSSIRPLQYIIRNLDPQSNGFIKENIDPENVIFSH